MLDLLDYQYCCLNIKQENEKPGQIQFLCSLLSGCAFMLKSAKSTTWLNACLSSIIILRTQPRLSKAKQPPPLLQCSQDTTTASQHTTMRIPNEGYKQPLTQFLRPDFAPIKDFVFKASHFILIYLYQVALYPKHAIFVPMREIHKACDTELESDDNRLERNGKPNEEGCRVSPHDYIQKLQILVSNYN
jgi:hypothetical protein